MTTPVSPKGPERVARPEDVVTLELKVSSYLGAWLHAASDEPVGAAPKFHRTAERLAPDLIRDVFEPEVERLTAEASALRSDLRIRQGALNDVLGRERSADYYSAVEDVAELKRENGRLTAEVERLRDATDRVVELEHDADRVRDALLPILRGHRYTQHEVQGDWLRSGYVAERAANLLRRDAAVENSLRGDRDRAVSLARDLTEERDEWKQAAGAEADLLDQADAEVSRLREQLATAREQVERTRRAERRSIAAVLTGMLEELETAYVGEFGDGPAESRDKLRAVQAFSVELDEFELGVSSSEVPQPQEMVQHTVEIRHVWRGVGHARCLTCGEMSEVGIESYVQDWADRHVADTLRPQAFQDYDLTDVKPGTGFFVPKDEGRPSGSERLAPRSDDDLVAHLRNLVTRLKDNVRTGEEKGLPNEIAFDDGWCGAMVHAGNELETLLDQYGPNGWDPAAQAARSEATPQDPLAVVATETEPSGAVMTECPDGAQCHRECVAPACIRVATCGPMSRVFPSDRWPHEVVAKHGPGSLTEDPSPSLRKEGEDR